MDRRSSLRLRSMRLLVTSVLSGLILAGVVFFLGNVLVDSLVSNENFRMEQTEKRVRSFQDYVERHELAATDSVDLLVWCNRQPLVFMEIYRDGKLLFNSTYFQVQDELLSDRDVDAILYDWYSYQEIEFSDGTADLLIFCDEAYQLRTWVTVGSVFAGMTLLLAVFLRGVASVAKYIGELGGDVRAMEGGDLSRGVTVQGDDELTELAEGLDSMRRAFLAQRESEALSLQANQSLITGLSHDLRTPLTEIMLFVEILRNGRYEDEDKLKDYLGRIEANAEQIRRLSDDILQYSLAQSSVGKEDAGLRILSDVLREPLSEMMDFLRERGFDLDCPEDLPCDRTMVSEGLLQRVLDNLASNIDKYADRAKPVVVRIEHDSGRVGITFENAVDKKVISLDGAGVGLANVRYLMGKMEGSCEVRYDDDAFRVTLWFKMA